MKYKVGKGKAVLEFSGDESPGLGGPLLAAVQYHPIAGRRITSMADILECVAGALWIALGIYAAIKFRRLNRRMDAILSEIERDLHNGH